MWHSTCSCRAFLGPLGRTSWCIKLEVLYRSEAASGLVLLLKHNGSQRSQFYWITKLGAFACRRGVKTIHLHSERARPATEKCPWNIYVSKIKHFTSAAVADTLLYMLALCGGDSIGSQCVMGSCHTLLKDVSGDLCALINVQCSHAQLQTLPWGATSCNLLHYAT